MYKITKQVIWIMEWQNLQLLLKIIQIKILKIYNGVLKIQNQI